MIKNDFIERPGPESNRDANFARAQEERLRQQEAAYLFLTTGVDFEVDEEPPYGKEWDRNYNTTPYPEAVPIDEMYDGTSIGLLYGMDCKSGDRRFSHHGYLEMAGWNLVREGVEVFRAETKVDKKELIPPGEREE